MERGESLHGEGQDAAGEEEKFIVRLIVAACDWRPLFGCGDARDGERAMRKGSKEWRKSANDCGTL